MSTTAPYALETQIAISAVRRACLLTSSVFNRLVKNETLTKGDKSPVTVADYSAQALISSILQHNFPSDPIVGEEDAKDLREPGNEMTRRVVELADEAVGSALVEGEKAEWGFGPGVKKRKEEWLDAIDRGNYEGGRSGRMWTIDPIDGTKGFLRGEQYAVCLALLVDAQVQVGVIGCPNLYVDASNPDGERGCVFVAVKGQGTQQINLSGGPPIPLSMPPLPSTLRFLESVEAAHSNHGINDQVSAKLGNTAPSIRMDSQAKYACLARGDGGIYMRVKTNDDTYEEKIWDHAAGSLLVQEAGGIVTDGHGKPLDFGVGRTLKHNTGIVGAGRDIHPKAIQALSEIWSQAVAKA